jgi:phosphohistidine phosphatase
MKNLLLIRHAKSSWDDPAQKDFDRPLNERGKKDAPEMAKRVKEKGIKPDLIVSSTARRARKTAKYFAAEFDIDKDHLFLTEHLYEASVNQYREVLCSLSNQADTVLLFAHNPGITAFANTLTTVRIDDMPTCSVFAVQGACTTWNEFLQADRKFLFFDYPKM